MSYTSARRKRSPAQHSTAQHSQRTSTGMTPHTMDLPSQGPQVLLQPGNVCLLQSPEQAEQEDDAQQPSGE